MKFQKLIIFGKIPPPIGGVTISVKNLINSLTQYGISSSLLSMRSFFCRYDVAHIHYSSLWKRTLGVLLGRLIARKVIFTVHGKYLDTSNLFNKASVKFANGIILLNQQLYESFKGRPDSEKFIVLPSIFKEGIVEDSANVPLFNREDDFKYLLLYAYDKTFNNGEEIYGVDFVLNNIDKFEENIKLVLLDLSGKYAEQASNCAERVIYINTPVNFMGLLKQIDVYLRPTCMDGASVAVQEALMTNTPVLASDVVDRPDLVSTYEYGNINDFIQKLKTIKPLPNTLKLKSVKQYVEFCENL